MPVNAPSALQDRQHGPASLPAGSELDARVATALGWTRNATAIYPWRWKDEAGHTCALPAVSRNPDDAIRLLRVLLAHGWPVTIKYSAGQVEAFTSRRTAAAETIPHAVSLLALQLLESSSPAANPDQLVPNGAAE